MCSDTLQVRKKSSQLVTLERQLDDKVAELSDVSTASAQTDKELSEKLQELHQVNVRLSTTFSIAINIVLFV